MNEVKNVTIIETNRVIKDYAVGIYVRVNTTHKEQMDSLAAQVSGLTRLAAANRTWFVADVFIDIASAKEGSDRPEFERMLSACERKELDIILIKSLSRFSRDAKEGLEAVRRVRNAGGRLISVRDKIDTATASDEVLISAIEACEQAENEWRSTNIRMGLKAKAQSGESGLYSRPCFGYKKDRNGMLIIDDEQAEIVRHIYDWYLEGQSIGGIVKRLKERGIKSPTGRDQWSKRGVESVLTREKYTGDVAIIDSGGSGNRYLNRDHHEGIITKEQFKAVQIEMESRSNVEMSEDGTSHRKRTKYSSKRK